MVTITFCREVSICTPSERSNGDPRLTRRRQHIRCLQIYIIVAYSNTVVMAKWVKGRDVDLNGKRSIYLDSVSTGLI